MDIAFVTKKASSEVEPDRGRVGSSSLTLRSLFKDPYYTALNLSASTEKSKG